MKSSLTYLKNFLVCFGATALLLLTVGGAKAQILIINVTNPNAVTITATNGNATNGASGTFADGIDLLGLLASPKLDAPGSGGGPNASTLTTSDGGSGYVYNSFVVDDLTSTTGVFNNVSLNLFYSTVPGGPTGLGSEVFVSGAQALTDSSNVTFDLSGLNLRTSGTGEIVTGFDPANGSTTPNIQIGEYKIVDDALSAPEPSTWMLMGVGVVLLALFRSRFRARQD